MLSLISVPEISGSDALEASIKVALRILLSLNDIFSIVVLLESDTSTAIEFVKLLSLKSLSLKIVPLVPDASIKLELVIVLLMKLEFEIVTLLALTSIIVPLALVYVISEIFTLSEVIVNTGELPLESIILPLPSIVIDLFTIIPFSPSVLGSYV